MIPVPALGLLLILSGALAGTCSLTQPTQALVSVPSPLGGLGSVSRFLVVYQGKVILDLVVVVP